MPASEQSSEPGVNSSVPWLLISRPARETDREALREIAAAANIGNMRPEKVEQHIELSRDTLANILPWDQGLVYLATELFPSRDFGSAQVVASCKLQFMFDTCWLRKTRARIAKRTPTLRSQSTLLVFDSTKSHGLEFAGNVVSESHRGRKIGKFQVQARLLFVLIHGINRMSVTHLFANLLTDHVTKDGAPVYPFYETIVRRLLPRSPDCGNWPTYDEADDLRYKESQALTDLLGPNEETHEPAVQMPIHVLPKEIQDSLGSVRKITQRVQKVLEDYGFSKTDKFDFLDGGQYFGLALEDLRRVPYVRDLSVRRERTLPPDAEVITFAASRRDQKDFTCARSLAKIKGFDLLLAADVCAYLGLREGEDVKVVRDLPEPEDVKVSPS